MYVPAHLGHLLELLARLLLPEEVERGVDLHLPPVVEHQKHEEHQHDAGEREEELAVKGCVSALAVTKLSKYVGCVIFTREKHYIVRRNRII